MSEQTKPSDLKISELSIENAALKAQVDELTKRVEETDHALHLANDVIEADLKARLSQKIMAGSKYTIEDLSKMGVDEMKSIEQVLDMSRGAAKGIRPGPGHDVADMNLTVPDKYAFGKKGV